MTATTCRTSRCASHPAARAAETHDVATGHLTGHLEGTHGTNT